MRRLGTPLSARPPDGCLSVTLVFSGSSPRRHAPRSSCTNCVLRTGTPVCTVRALVRRWRVSRVEFEHRPAHGGLDRIVDVDSIYIADDPHDELAILPNERSEDVAEECNSVAWFHLHRGYLNVSPSNCDRRPAGRPQIAHPIDFAEWSYQPASARALYNRNRRGARYARLPAPNRDQHIGTHWYASRQ